MTIKPEQYGVGYIGASNVANIMGVGIRSPLETYFNILGHKTRTYKGGIDYANFGHMFESDVLALFAKQKGGVVDERQKEVMHPCRDANGYHYIRAHLDGMYHNEGISSPVEAKLVNKFAKSKWITTGVPINYYYQILEQMLLTCSCTGYVCAAFIDWAILDEQRSMELALDDFVIFTITEDPELMQQMLAAQIYFWENHIFPKLPPLPDRGRNDFLFQVRLLRDMQPKETGALPLTAELREELVAAYIQHKNVKKDIRAVSAILNNLKKEEENMLGNLEYLLGNYTETEFIPELGGRFMLEEKERKGFSVAPSKKTKVIFLGEDDAKDAQ